MTSALLLVDIQNDFCPGGALAVTRGDEVVPVANKLQSHFKHVIASLDWHPQDHISFQNATLESADIVKWPSHCVQHSLGAELHPKLHTDLIDLRVQKGCSPQHENFSAFCNDPRQTSCDLERYLKERNITDLYIMGLATECCVLQTVLDALRLGFRVTVIEDGIRGIGSEKQQREAKEIMKKQGARFVESTEW